LPYALSRNPQGKLETPHLGHLVTIHQRRARFANAVVKARDIISVHSCPDTQANPLSLCSAAALMGASDAMKANAM
jgi:hypothetical protein